jgi:O-glycosyl hydrolase
MEFIPMLWGGNTSTSDLTGVKNFIIAHPEVKYLLVMNEPNLTDQANRTPSQAAADWLKYEQVVNDLAGQGRTVYLVGPAMSWGTMPGYSDPVVWLDAFYSAYKAANGNRIPQIDYLAFHWYDYGLSSQLNRLQKYGKKIWITEMANWNAQINSYAKQAVEMQKMVDTCESRSDVFRYAWFIGRGTLPDNKFTYLFTNTPGELTDLGKLYISLPYSKQ